MAFNNFPVGYQPYYPQYQQPQINVPQNAQNAQNNGGIIWVQGEAGAKSYLVAPNTTVQLWDSESQVIYLKSADASGMPSMKVLDYKIRQAEQPRAVYVEAQASYATKDDLQMFRDEIAELKRRLNSIEEGAEKHE